MDIHGKGFAYGCRNPPQSARGIKVTPLGEAPAKLHAALFYCDLLYSISAHPQGDAAGHLSRSGTQQVQIGSEVRHVATLQRAHSYACRAIKWLYSSNLVAIRQRSCPTP